MITNQLEACLPRMTARDQEIARSLIEQGKRRGLSQKQTDFADILICRTAAAALAGARAERRARLDLSRITAMFDRAAAQMKKPFVVFATYAKHPEADGGGTYIAAEFRVSRAPVNGKNPLALYVKEGRTYLGKITPDGSFHAANVQGGTGHVMEALQAFAADPAAAALAYGQATGSCCFCAHRLSDARSVTVGYGPTCADRFGLPWGL